MHIIKIDWIWLISNDQTDLKNIKYKWIKIEGWITEAICDNTSGEVKNLVNRHEHDYKLLMHLVVMADGGGAAGRWRRERKHWVENGDSRDGLPFERW